MKRSSMLLVALVFATIGGAGLVASANHCGTNGSAHDPFGSCETSGGDAKCGSGTDAQVATVSTASTGNGAQACNDDGPIPPFGRASVWTDGSKVVVGVDGDRDNPGSNGWSRADVSNTSGCQVKVRRGSGNGSYWTSGGGTSTPDAANQCIGG